VRWDEVADKLLELPGTPQAVVEKVVDAALVTDLLSLAWQRAYDVTFLASGDADYIPAVEYFHAQGLRVINAAWRSKGHELRTACWAASTSMD